MFGPHFLELRVLSLGRLQPLGIGDLHHGIFAANVVERSIADPVHATQVRRAHARCVLLQHANDLRFAEMVRLHRRSIPLDNSILANVARRKNVSAAKSMHKWECSL